jgi:hypothetical protein
MTVQTRLVVPQAQAWSHHPAVTTMSLLTTMILLKAA